MQFEHVKLKLCDKRCVYVFESCVWNKGDHMIFIFQSFFSELEELAFTHFHALQYDYYVLSCHEQYKCETKTYYRKEIKTYNA